MGSGFGDQNIQHFLFLLLPSAPYSTDGAAEFLQGEKICNNWCDALVRNFAARRKGSDLTPGVLHCVRSSCVAQGLFCSELSPACRNALGLVGNASPATGARGSHMAAVGLCLALHCPSHSSHVLLLELGWEQQIPLCFRSLGKGRDETDGRH